MTVAPRSQKQLSQPVVVRTERGLTVSGSRITLYDVMDYYGKRLSEYNGDPLGYVRYALPALSEVELQAAADYIELNRAEVEHEYKLVLEQAKSQEQYWRAQNKALFSEIAAMPLTPEKTALRQKIKAHKAKLAAMNGSTALHAQA